jgi:hypothetical protein
MSIWLAAFFPPGLHPVLDGSIRNKNPVITPQVPAGGLIGQAVLHNEPNGQCNDTMGVMGLGQGVVGHVRVEVLPAASATMLRVDDVDIARATSNQVSHVMQNAFACTVAEAGLVADRTTATPEVPAPAHDLGFGQILGTSDAFRWVRQILSGARHSKALLGHVVWPRNLRDFLL